MEDTELTRIAIEEIVREMNKNKELEQQQAQERKINPIAKPNKRFLGRTINSMLTHNKREDYRIQKRCQRKLKELDDMQRQRYKHKRERRTHYRRRRSRSPYPKSSSSESDASRKKQRHKRKKKKTKKTKSRHISRNSSESTSRSNKHIEKLGPVCAEEFYETEDCEYMTPFVNAAFSQYLHYQAMLNCARAANADAEQMQIDAPTTTYELKREKPPDTINSSISCSSSTSCMEEDENGMLTIKVSSTDENSCQSSYRKGKKKRTCSSSDFNLNENSTSRSSMAVDETNNVPDCISLDSDDTKSSVCVLTSSSEPETETPSNIATKKVASSKVAEEMVDLTED